MPMSKCMLLVILSPLFVLPMFTCLICTPYTYALYVGLVCPFVLICIAYVYMYMCIIVTCVLSHVCARVWSHGSLGARWLVCSSSNQMLI